MKNLKSKKILPLLLALVLACSVLVLSGCTNAGAGYLKLSKEVTQLDKYTMAGSGQMSMDLSGIFNDQATDPAQKKILEEQLAMLKNIKFTYTGAALTAENLYEIKTKMTYNGKPEVALDMYMKGSSIIIDAPQLVNMLEVIGGTAAKAEIEATKKALAGAAWLDLDTLGNLLGDSDFGGIDYTALSQTLYGFVDYLNQNSFKDYAPKVFAEKGKGYEMRIAPDQVAPLTKEFAHYVITNSQAIVDDLKIYVNKFDQTLFDTMGIPKAQVLALLDQLPQELNKFSKEELAQMDVIIDQVCDMLKGTEFTGYLGKTADKKYEETASMKMVMNNPENAAQKVNLTLSASATIDGTAPVVIYYPATGVKTVSEAGKGIKPNAVTGILFAKDGKLVWTKGYAASILNTSGIGTANVLEKDNSLYLPMRQLAQTFGEEVLWENNAVYAVVDGKKVKLDSIQSNDTAFVKIREFEKLGYTVSYVENEGGIITLSKGN